MMRPLAAFSAALPPRSFTPPRLAVFLSQSGCVLLSGGLIVGGSQYVLIGRNGLR
jgi:hypothetical protein